MTDDEFQEQFNSRTLAYLGGTVIDRRPVALVLDAEVHSEPGHIFAASLVNQLARAHSQLVIVGDLDRPLMATSPFGETTLGEATVGLAEAINPFISVTHVSDLSNVDPVLSIGVGDGTRADLAVGWNGGCASFGQGARAVEDSRSNWGAMFAACLSAATAFRRALGDGALPGGSFSLWRWADSGCPEATDPATPVSVGDGFMAGAGAVGAATCYWLAFVGVEGHWTVADGDTVDVSNLNRQLLFLAADAGFPTGQARSKADVVAERLQPIVRAINRYYVPNSGDPELDHAAESADVVLALANNYGVRAALQSLQLTVLLHATTSRDWGAQFHRHVAGVDDCIVCRLPDDTAIFGCATADVGGEDGMDAALPFLSGTAGLFLAAALARLQAGTLMDERSNYHLASWATGALETFHRVYKCRETCHVRLPDAVRPSIGNGRWRDLDPATRLERAAG